MSERPLPVSAPVPLPVRRPPGRWGRLRQSDLLYSFRRSPLVMVAAFVTAVAAPLP